MSRDLSPVLPENIDVWFVGRQCAGLCAELPDAYWPKTYVATAHLASVVLTDPDVTVAPEGVPGTTRVIRDTAHALFATSAGMPTNLVALNALRDRIAQDLYDWASVGVDLVLNGINAVTPCGILDTIEFRYDATGQHTRAQSAPWGGYPVELQHMDPAVATPNCTAWDRAPGVLLEMVATTTAASQGVISLEDGRLVAKYDGAVNFAPCAPPPPPCGTLCIRPLDSCSGGVAPVPTATITLTLGATVIGSAAVTSQVASVAVGAQGSGYSSAPAVSFSGGGGTGAAATATITASVTALSLTNGGGGYTARPTVSFTGGGGGGATATCTITPTSVASIAITGGGTGYSSPPSVGFTGGGGTGATAAAVLTGTSVTSVTVTNGGANYTSVPTVSFSGGGGSGAAGTALLNGTSIASITLVLHGSGYTSTPTVGFVGGGAGFGATVAVTLNYGVTSYAVTAGGSGYSSAPTVVLTGGGGTGAAGTATIKTQACFNIYASGTYLATAAAPDYATGSITFPVSPCQSLNENITITPNGGVACLTAIGCKTFLDGASIVIRQGGVIAVSGTTSTAGLPVGSNPQFCADLPLGSFTATLTMDRYDFPVLNFTLTACGSRQFQFDNTSAHPASGFRCLGQANPATVCQTPASETLHLTSAVYGNVTLSYSSTSPSGTWPVGVGVWEGSAGGSSACLGGAAAVIFSMNASSLALIVFVVVSGHGWSAGITMTRVSCPSGLLLTGSSSHSGNPPYCLADETVSVTE